MTAEQGEQIGHECFMKKGQRSKSQGVKMGLPSKPNTLYKLIRFLEHVPDGRGIPWETDIRKQS